MSSVTQPKDAVGPLDAIDALPASASPWPDRPRDASHLDALVAAHARTLEERKAGSSPDDLDELDALWENLEREHIRGEPALVTQTELDAGGAIPLAQWDKVRAMFQLVFAPLGEVTEDGNGLEFASRPPDVATGMTIRRDGRISASMPLHGLEAEVDEVRWNAGATEIALAGTGINYVYRIPCELLRYRGNPR